MSAHTAINSKPTQISFQWQIHDQNQFNIHFSDRFRTVVNVWGDCIGAGLLDHIFRHRFSKFKRQENLPTDTPSEGDSASTTLTIEKKEGVDDVSTGDGVYVKTADGYVNKVFENDGVTRLWKEKCFELNYGYRITDIRTTCSGTHYDILQRETFFSEEKKGKWRNSQYENKHKKS